MELEVRTVGGMENCFVSLPLVLIQTLERRPGFASAMDRLSEILVLELRNSSSDEVWTVSWSGATSTSSAIEVSKQFADCISLPDCTTVQVRAVSSVPNATEVLIEPYSEDDWEVLELNAEIAEAAMLNQLRIIHEAMRFPLWLHGRTVVTFRVVSTSPKCGVVQLVHGTEVEVFSKTRKKFMDSRKAMLRVQDLDKRLIYNSNCTGIEIRVVPTSVAFIHPQTAKSFSLNSLELVSIMPRSSRKDSGQRSENNDLGKLKGSTAEANSGERNNGEKNQPTIVYLLNSNLVNEGHIMMARSLRLYLRINLHSWVLVKPQNVNLKVDFSSASLSPCYFKVYEDDVPLAKNDLKASDIHRSVKRKNMVGKTSSLSFMDVANVSAHEQVVDVLTRESSCREDEDACHLPSVKKGLQILFREWFFAHLNAMASSVGTEVNSVLLGNQSLLHFEVSGLKFGTKGNIKSASVNASEYTTKTVEILYAMTIFEEPLQGVFSNAFKLSFDEQNKCVINLGGVELSKRLHFGDPVSFSTIKEKTYVEVDSLDVSSLSWLDESLPNVINRIKVLLSPRAGVWFGTHNIPLPGHILICGPPGSGKTLLARAAAKFLQEYDDLLAHVVFVCCSQLASEKVQTIRQSLLNYVSEALEHAPSLIVFDDLDSIILSTSESEGSQLSASMSAITEFLIDMIDEYEEKRKSSCQVGPIAFVASVQTLDKIPQSLRSSGRFDFHVELPAPAALERAAILKHEVQRRALDCSDVTLQDIASKCDGYDAYDLEILVDRAVHAAVSRFLPLHFAHNQNQNPTLVENDFSLAMNEFVPASMRDITKPAAEGGRSGWDDVGGLVEVKSSIKEMIVFPSKFPNIFAQAPLRLRSNVLLYGPPGCGKTHIVGAAAAACSLRFISVKGPELLNKYVGASEQAVRDIFSLTLLSFCFVLLSKLTHHSLFFMDSMDRSRTFLRDVKRLVIKVGTAVVTRSDGRLALGRLGALCEQIKELNSQEYEVILVSSGAVGIGRQRLRYRKLVNSSFADLQKPQVDLDGKACAAVGQNSLMALYDTLFSQLDVTSAQLLVTDNDFRDKDFRRQLSDTVKSLLTLKVVPIFNENDAVSTRKAPYEDSSGIFWDNDSLAALLALELKADLLVLLSDVDGLYSGPPSDPHSKLIHTYVKERHQGEITFGDKSRVGRGGMTAKVKAATGAAYAGIPVVITSGYAPGNILKVLKGDRIGTLFHQDAHLWTPQKDVGARDMAVAARESSRRLQAISSQERRKILLDIADALEANEKLISTENEADVAEAQQSGYEKALVSRLAMKPGKISSLANSIRTLANMEDPIGHVLKRTEVSDGLVLEKTSSPLGVLLIVFESRPDALVQIASLAIRSGNGLLLKGGKEARRSNAILHKVITEAIPESIGGTLIGLVTSREEIPDLLKLDDVIDLVIPRGSNKLVSQIKNSTKIPVLGHADGICHVYVDKSADLEMSKRIVLDAKIDYPAACNAMETLLVHKDLVQTGGLNELVVNLRIEGVTLNGGPRASSLLNIPEARTFHHEYNSLACTLEIVDDVFDAIDHIHQHGSAHTDCIVTEDHEVAEVFLRQVDSAAVFHNASTRFSDGARFGLGAEVGISTSRIHARGPVGVEGLLTTRWILRGSGQVVDGDKGVVYTHRDIKIES